MVLMRIFLIVKMVTIEAEKLCCPNKEDVCYC